MSNGHHVYCSARRSISLLAAAVLSALTCASASAQNAPTPENAAADQTTTQPPSPSAAQPATQLDTVVVTGLNRSLMSAQAIKQNAVQIVDSIVAEDIGKLPDITASASLARVSGVQAARGGGEATNVQVRGLPNITTTYNGRDMFTAENRNVALQDFPAGGISGLDVYKSSTAELIEPGIAGLINVRSRRPFDFEGFEAFGSVNQILAEQANNRDLNGNFLISNRWQTGIGEMGLLINGSWNRVRFLDSTREQSLVVGRARPGQAEQPGFRFPDGVATYFGQQRRTRPSLNAAFQWQPNEHWEITADLLFQGYRASGHDSFMSVPLYDEDTEFTNVETVPGAYGPQARRFTATGGFRPDGFQTSSNARTNTYQLGVDAVYDRDNIRWSTGVARTDSTYVLRQTNVDFALADIPIRDIDFNVQGGDGGPTYSFRDYDLKNPSNFVFRGLYDRNYRATGSDMQLRTDFEYTPDDGVITAWQTGLRYTNRDANRYNNQIYVPWEQEGLLYTDLPLDFYYTGPGFRGSDHAPPRTWIAPLSDSIRYNGDALRALVGLPAGLRPLDRPVFDANEKAYTAYGQLEYAFDAGVSIDGAIGLRAVRTEGSMSGTTLRDEVYTPITRDNSYTDLLPNASMRVHFNDQWQLRLAATQTRTRANFDQLNPATSFATPSQTCIDDPQDLNCVLTASSGNPDLAPLESRNYDLSLEYYFAPTGAMSLALFRRDVTGFISNFTTDLDDPTYRVLRMTRPENGGEGRLQGVEFAFTTFLDFDRVPQWARAFGLQANYTYIDSGAELGPSLAASLPGKPRIPGVSKNLYNLVLMYEKPVFSARLAYNWRSKYVQEYAQIRDPVLGPIGANGYPEGALGPALPLVHDAYGTLDFSMNYTPIEDLTFAFDVSNILGDPAINSRQYNAEGDEFPRQIRYMETIYSLGLRFRF